MISFRGGINLKEYNRTIFAGEEFNKDTVPGLAHWVKADDLATLYQNSTKTTPVTGDGQPVGAWVDQIEAEYLQATTSAKPTYRASVAVLGNRPALQFDGNDFLQGAFGAAITQPDTVFVVYKLGTIAGTQSIFDGDDSTNRQDALVFGGNWAILAPGLVSGSAADINANIGVAVFNGASSAYHVNGISKVSGNAGSGAIDGLTLGSSNSGASGFVTGHISEFLIYGGSLSVSNKNIVQNYLSAKYGISVTEF